MNILHYSYFETFKVRWMPWTIWDISLQSSRWSKLLSWQNIATIAFSIDYRFDLLSPNDWYAVVGKTYLPGRHLCKSTLTHWIWTDILNYRQLTRCAKTKTKSKIVSCLGCSKIWGNFHQWCISDVIIHTQYFYHKRTFFVQPLEEHHSSYLLSDLFKAAQYSYLHWF